MRTLQLAVIQIAGSWCMLLNGERVGRFARRGQAVSCAIDAAAFADQDGVPVEVLIQDECGEVAAMSVGLAAGCA